MKKNSMEISTLQPHSSHISSCPSQRKIVETRGISMKWSDIGLSRKCNLFANLDFKHKPNFPGFNSGAGNIKRMDGLMGFGDKIPSEIIAYIVLNTRHIPITTSTMGCSFAIPFDVSVSPVLAVLSWHRHCRLAQLYPHYHQGGNLPMAVEIPF